jgi:hypothetical protein
MSADKPNKNKQTNRMDTAHARGGGGVERGRGAQNNNRASNQSINQSSAQGAQHSQSRAEGQRVLSNANESNEPASRRSNKQTTKRANERARERGRRVVRRGVNAVDRTGMRLSAADSNKHVTPHAAHTQRLHGPTGSITGAAAAAHARKRRGKWGDQTKQTANKQTSKRASVRTRECSGERGSLPPD